MTFSWEYRQPGPIFFWILCGWQGFRFVWKVQDSSSRYGYWKLVGMDRRPRKEFLISLVSLLASYSCYDILIRANSVSRIPLVHGFYLVGGSEYMVSDLPSCSLQGFGQTYYPLFSAIYIGNVLYHLDLDPLYCISRCVVPILGNGKGSDWRDGDFLAYAHDFHPSTFCTLYVESEMDVWFVPTDRETVDGIGPQIHCGSEWIVSVIFLWCCTVENQQIAMCRWNYEYFQFISMGRNILDRTEKSISKSDLRSIHLFIQFTNNLTIPTSFCFAWPSSTCCWKFQKRWLSIHWTETERTYLVRKRVWYYIQWYIHT